jgi:diketogulonate reductase-like aldo/keto reductase
MKIIKPLLNVTRLYNIKGGFRMIDAIRLNTGYSMPALGLGTWQLTGADCRKAVGLALELGYRHIDTSDDYNSEEDIGRAIKGFDRAALFITSKVDDTLLRKNDLVEACKGSLKRLGTDYLDLYLIHRPNPAVPITETMQGMEELVEQGLVRSIGISNFSRAGTEAAAEASGVPVCVNQIKIHPYHYPAAVIKYLKENGIAVTAYSPLDTGQLADDELLTGIGRQYNKSACQVSLRWLLDKGLIVIPKATTPEHLREDIDLFDWELSKEDTLKIDNLSDMALRG